jgi:hypothetical protein
MTDPLLGQMHPTETCPRCGSRIMYNVAGNYWCVGQDCDYHLRHGQLVTAAMVKRLGDQCPIRVRE